MLGIADEEDAFHGCKSGAGDLRQGVDRCGGALGVAFKDEALRRALGKDAVDVVDDLRSSGK